MHMHKPLATAAIAALLAASLGLSGLVPAQAQDATSAATTQATPVTPAAAPSDPSATPGNGSPWAGMPGGPWGRPGGMQHFGTQRFGGPRGNLFAIVRGDRGLEAL